MKKLILTALCLAMISGAAAAEAGKKTVMLSDSGVFGHYNRSGGQEGADQAKAFAHDAAFRNLVETCKNVGGVISDAQYGPLRVDELTNVTDIYHVSITGKCTI